MCCPPYTIRLHAPRFTPSKAQRRVMRKWERFLSGSLVPDRDSKPAVAPHRKATNSFHEKSPQPPDASHSLCPPAEALLERIVQQEMEEGRWPKISLSKIRIKAPTSKCSKGLPKGVVCTSPAPFAMAAAFNAAPGDMASKPWSAPNICQRLARGFNESQREGPIAGIRAQACGGHLNFFSCDEQTDGFAPDVSNPTSRPSPSAASSQSPGPPGHRPSPTPSVASWKDTGAGTPRGASMNDGGVVASGSSSSSAQAFTFRLARSSMDDEEYELYKRYQMAVHGDSEAECAKWQYRRFLVTSPLTPVSREEDPAAPACGYGAFHAQYRVGGRLVAVGVVDVLPRCLSSKYLFWDPDLAALSLGKVSALKEIEWVRAAASPRLQYYYMGYYIHGCTKMRYKAEYGPSDLLCPAKLCWVQFGEGVRKALDLKKYVELSGLPGVECSRNDVEAVGEEEGGVQGQRLSLNGRRMTLRELYAINPGQREVLDLIAEEVRRWREAVGPVRQDMVYDLH
eukprot:evm.model.scf_527.5 EVM.evm.TU.scf_527.5   scf_527:56635-64501(+)